jgi:hypothetical protein
VYVRGDYNTVAKVPAGILADAVTVLSGTPQGVMIQRGPWVQK